MFSRLRVVAFGFLIIVGGCRSKDMTTSPADTSSANSATPASSTGTNPASTSPAASPAVKAKVDVCALIDGADLKRVQGEQPKDMQRSDRVDAGFIVSQCYYSLPTTNNSVVLNVTTKGEGPGARDPREYWEVTFASKAEKDEPERKRENKPKAKGEEEEGEAAARPQKIAGLGEDAYWIANRVGGALYVLKKDLFFRVSVGGAGDANAKLKRSRSLAQSVLQRI